MKARAAGVSEALGGGGLGLLINNAGILTPGPLEVLPLDAIRHEFEVDVFGALSVMNAFLPALRAGRGRVITGQQLDREPSPSFQRAVRCIEGGDGGFRDRLPGGVETLWNEVVVAPAGNMRTGGPAKTAAALARIAGGMLAQQRDLYGQTFETFATALNGMQSSGLEFGGRRSEKSSSWLNKPLRRAARRWDQTRKRCCSSFGRSPTPSWMHSACSSSA